VYYELGPQEQSSSRGIIEVDPRTSLVTAFFEKPAEGVSSSRFASVVSCMVITTLSLNLPISPYISLYLPQVFYMFRRTSLPLLATYLAAHPAIEQRVFGSFLAWLVAPPASAPASAPASTPASSAGAPASRHRLYGMKLATAFELIGQSGLQEYLACVEGLQQSQRRGAALGASAASPITRRAHARVGLVGNPSDGFFGKTISVSVENFWAEVAIHESDTVRLVPNVLSDPNDFGSLADLHGISRKEGYQGGLVLLQATCKKFHEYCSKRGIALAKRNFTLRYNTNIPRQVGLAGSSAIVTAAFQCLMAFYQLGERDIPKALQPDFVLSVEMEELFIQAGRYREI